MKNILLISLLFLGTFGFSQTANKNLNRDLATLRKAYIDKNAETIAELVYAKSFDMIGGKSNFIMMVKMADEQMKKNNVSIVSITHKNVGKLVKYKNELQIPMDEVTVIKAKDKNSSNTITIIAISSDNGKNWKFINTMNQSKANVLKLFPNLDPNLEIKSNPLPKHDKHKK